MPELYNDNRPVLAETVLPAGNFQDTLDFFVDRLGFRIDSIAPADDPAIAQISGHGLHLCIDRDYAGDAGSLCLRMSDDGLAKVARADVTAPNGTRIAFKAAVPALHLPALRPSLCIQRLDKDAWNVGRAGMLYRDLIDDRQGGRFIASHIRIPKGGPVPDNVHYHNIHFQLIYCYRGWVRLVYEDQGEPFVMRAGDCVLQPPLIRHRVLEASDGLEVIEVGSPAEHMTYLDHQMSLPTAHHRPERLFGDQHYTFYCAREATWQPTTRFTGNALPGDAFWSEAESSDLGLFEATNQIVSARVVRCKTPQATSENQRTHTAQLAFWFVLKGSMELSTTDGLSADASTRVDVLSTGDSLVVPAGMPYRFTQAGHDLELLEIVVPASATTASPASYGR